MVQKKKKNHSDLKKKKSFTWLDLVIWSWSLFTIGDSNAPKIIQNM